jgi:hypothetical protein
MGTRASRIVVYRFTSLTIASCSMRPFMRLISAIIVGSAIGVVSGCAGSELVDIWSDSRFEAVPLTKMLVISAAKNPVQRRIWEDAFSVELDHHGVVARPSYQLFPDAVPDTNQVAIAIHSESLDGVLVTRPLAPETNSFHTQGYVTQEQGFLYDRRSLRFVSYYREIEHAGYVDSQKVYLRAIDVWSTRNDGEMIWSATSRTPEPASVQTARGDVVQLVTEALTQQHIIAAAR